MITYYFTYSDGDKDIQSLNLKSLSTQNDNLGGFFQRFIANFAYRVPDCNGDWSAA